MKIYFIKVYFVENYSILFKILSDKSEKIFLKYFNCKKFFFRDKISFVIWEFVNFFLIILIFFYSSCFNILWNIWLLNWSDWVLIHHSLISPISKKFFLDIYSNVWNEKFLDFFFNWDIICHLSYKVVT